MIKLSKFIDKSSLGSTPVWHIIHREFVTTCPHCAQNIYAFTDAVRENIKWNELSGHHIPIGGLRKPFPHEMRLSAALLRCYKMDEHMFYTEKYDPWGFVNFYNREDAVKFLKEYIIPKRLPFDPTVFHDEESKKYREQLIDRLADEEYFVIPVYPTDNVEYCVDATFSTGYNSGALECRVIILSDVFVTIEVEQYIK